MEVGSILSQASRDAKLRMPGNLVGSVEPASCEHETPRPVRATAMPATGGTVSSLSNGADPSGATDSDEVLHVTRMADVTAERVEWLWPGRLPIGKLVVLDGDPDMGKSTLSLDIAAKISTGAVMPDGHRLERPRNVVLLSAEDGPADTIRPRLDAAGADPSRVVQFEGVPILGENGERHERPPTIPHDIERIGRVVKQEQAAFVVIDVLTAYLGSRLDSYRDQDVRGALAPLAAMADRTRCCVLAIRHLNKSGGTNPLHRGGGSIGIIGAARVGLMVGTDPDDDTRKVLAISKCNLAAHAPSLAYRLVAAEEHGCARVEWLGTTGHKAADLLAAQSNDDDDTSDAKTVLAAILSDGPKSVKTVLAEGAEAGLTKDQLKRAKRKLGADSIKVGKPGDPESEWQWSLPRREHEESEGSGT
jgi:RecA-family ATPase